ncbi:MAG: ribonucleoside-diphosphate reductase [Gammaproteobacteria bacterium]|nr:ribonucleoside-diphosphate reductase [Gammaproteobacteria bacterium]NIR84182.1 ribonucleoside-diphosphate reductase [Gammaproteobacteria bacterium]NIR89494.1 ribonucleoside-diphosphate reductase [Gammaproteobacteria bacterium]NIU05337.1 ribonucleoside-diphosphate reductase [Gammaproteobacteria bacterium]NIV52277.1 ribonucleoside-diphosphate reductase [Gammaproteobacteria bacterium]
MQVASWDIWDKKYRLKRKDGSVIDETIDHTYRRVARALADVEETAEKRAEWYEQFLWALRNGAIPAGRIISNAGALEHKPATSTINCTVSGTVADSMDDILQKVHEAGLTLKCGSGTGYEFSTLRPKGAYVTGAGAYTSGPLSFMDIYDRMCFTVSSAGGRRGAQMATFDVGHPDVLDFIRAKRESGRLRQFNLSLLITREFMQKVKNDQEWQLAFPLMADEVEAEGIDLSDRELVVWRDWPIKDGYIVSPEGKVACRIYRKIRARRMWDLIMSSTYDFAEPGFILIDEANQMNNNWFCENIRATNPCVTAETWVHTSEGPRQVSDLIGKPFEARVEGNDYASGPEGFFPTGRKPAVRLSTTRGYELRLTSDHPVRVVAHRTRWATEREWRRVGDIVPGDEIVLHDHREAAAWDGAHTADEGYLMGLLLGDGYLNERWAVLSVWKSAAAVNDVAVDGSDGIMRKAEQALRNSFDTRGDFAGWHPIKGRSEYRMHSAALLRLAETFGVVRGNKHVTPGLEATSSAFHRGFLRGLFDTDGSVQGSQQKGVSVRLSQSSRSDLQAVQRMLLRLGIASSIYARRPEHMREMPDGQGGSKGYQCRAQYDLIVSADNLVEFDRLIGFEDTDKGAKLKAVLAGYRRTVNRERFTAVVESIADDGEEAVYDVEVAGPNAFDANGLYVHNCGEQCLPPYGACLLGSVNLTKFVLDPFTDRARFDWDSYRKTVAIFTRMLDNVVEINGLPLEEQRREIFRKRRHGMGYLGLGSTLTMLCMRYGSEDSLRFTEEVTREMALQGWRTGLELAREKGPAPIMEEDFEVTEEMLRLRPELAADGYRAGDVVKGKVLHASYSRYMQHIAEVDGELVDALAEVGARFTHHTSIAPTGTISLSLANNASNGIEPSFAHHYARNVIREGRKSKEKVDVFSFELLAYREFISSQAMPHGDSEESLPEYFVTADDITPKQHVDVQAAAQKWVDSSISKTANVPTDYAFEDFKDIYMYAYERGLKGCTTFRFNPQAFQGVLVKEKDLESTTYRFTLADGSVVEAKGHEHLEYDGELHTAANLYEALKEGYYGKF